MIDDLLTGAAVTIAPDRCLNSRHDRAGCWRCIDACPADAVAVRGCLPVVITDECVRCGACAAVCPTDAVDGPSAPERRLLDTCDQTSGDVITLVCDQHPRPGAAHPAAAVVRHGRCLASLHVEHLIAITRHGTRRVKVDVGWCGNCPLERAAGTIVSTAHAAAALVALRSGEPTPIVTVERGPAVPDPDDGAAEATVIDSSSPAMSRRGLFRSIRARAAAASAPVVVAAPVRLVHGPVAERLPHHLPHSRRRLLERLDQIPPADVVSPGVAGRRFVVPTALLPLADPHVDVDRCSACGWCARYCPTGALTFTTGSDASSDGSPFALTVLPSICLACDICAHACPEDALTFGPTIDATGLHHRRDLVSGRLVACDSCGIPAAAGGDGSARCFSCRRGSGIVTALRDDAGLMADLLARAPTVPAWATAESARPAP